LTAPLPAAEEPVDPDVVAAAVVLALADVCDEADVFD
jgi:hypothetical protein